MPTTFIEFHADLQTIAEKICDAGPNVLCEFMDCVADAIINHHSTRDEISSEAFAKFVGKISDKFGSETRILLSMLNNHEAYRALATHRETEGK